MRTYLAFPTPLAATGAVIAALIGASLVYALSRVLQLRATTIPIADVRRQARFVVLLILVEFATIAAFRYFRGSGYLAFEAVDILVELIRSGVVILLPLAIIVQFTRQTTDSLGLRKTDAWKMIVLGLFPSSVFFMLLVLAVPFAGAGFATLSASSHAYRFVDFLLTGLSEEIVWRGYVQTRLIARTTRMFGLLAASLAFGLWHLPINYLTFGGIGEAFAVSLLIQFPLGLGFGYMMMRCQNILPSAVYHLFFNWSQGFFQIPGL